MSYTGNCCRNFMICLLLLSNILKQTQAQNIGIGTNNPIARLHVADSSVVFSANGPASFGANNRISGAGRRLMWHAPRAAFRVGYVSSTNWDNNLVGEYSVAGGWDVTASGMSSVAFGMNTIASGTQSTAFGGNTSASNENSTAMGGETIASGLSSTAMGYGSIASGAFSTSLGFYTEAKAYGALSVGLYNNNADLPNPEVPAPSDRIFQIGNGTTLFNRTNPLTVLRNGNIGVGVVDPVFMLDVGDRIRLRSNSGIGAGIWLNNLDNSAISGLIGMRSNTEMGFYGPNPGGSDWRFYVNTLNGNAWLQGTLTQASDARLKKNIKPLSNTINNLRQLNGYTYNWKDKSNPDEQIGLLAQELQKVYPQLVREHDGKLSVNYSGMVPVLLQAIKEQQAEIDELKRLVKECLNR